MCSNKPNHINKLIDNLNHKKECNIENCNILELSYKNIPSQCSDNADPIFQDFRYGVVCDALQEFKERGLNKVQLILWKVLFSAIFPWDSDYDILRQNVNRRFVLFPWVIAMCKSKGQVIRAFKKCLKYKIPLCLRSGAHCYEPYSLCDGMIIDQSRRTGIVIDKGKKLF